MKKYLVLNDGDELHRQSPETFSIPNEADKQKVQCGALVTVVAKPERLDLKVTEVKWPAFRGTVINDLVSTEIHGLSRGDTVAFEARHIIGIEELCEQDPEDEAPEGLVTISLDMLDGYLPHVRIARCVLDDHTSIFIGRIEDKVAVSTSLRCDTTDEAKRLRAAAKSLGFVPTELEKTFPIERDPEHLFFLIKLPFYVKGPELLRHTREAIELVRAKASATGEGAPGGADPERVSGSHVDTTADAPHTFESEEEPDLEEFILSVFPDGENKTQALEARKEFMERLKKQIEHLFTRLAELGVVEVVAEFDGSCDEGQIKSVTASMGDEHAAPSLDETGADGKSLRETVEEIVFGKLSASHPGWETNNGASGMFTFDVASSKISREVNIRTEGDGDDDDDLEGDEEEGE